MTTHQRWTLALASVASLMVGLDALVVTTALNTIREQLGASLEALEWTFNAYTLAFAVFLLTASTVGDRIGRRRLLIAGLTVFTLASAACALSTDIGVLIAARAIQGVGGAMIMPAAFTLVAVAFPPEQRGRAMGIFAGITGLAILGGPVVGGAVVQGLTWEWIFWLNVPIGLVLIPLVARFAAESTGPATKIDILGVALSGLGVLGLVWGLVRGNTSGWSSPEILGTSIGGGVLLAAFVGWELRTPYPMVPMRLFTHRSFSAANLAGLLMTASLFGMAFFFAQYLQAGLSYSPLGSGLRLLPWTATLFVVAPIAGARMTRIGERRLIVGGLLLTAAGAVWIALAAGTGAGYAALIAPMVVAGVGVSAAMPAIQNAAISTVGPESIGTASGIYNTTRQLGGSFGIAVASAVFTVNGGYTTTTAVEHGFRAAVLAAAIAAALGAASGLGVVVRQRRSPTPTTEPVTVATA
ncbi:DHA2 family efflux MFS transporter permease subunit [Nocardia sp. CDC153]|uniref:DHA2 family efflux MFS transporter permease subunit n=1 Tax=Nocardia sp. CDC153 TaxID=3112167 RepID=UPI002DB761BA|nr:DHA2 family efflux MFS transporter permease subunit [Nocardia sp. CDC153]MEC3952322.1 DHA2 family efflux MFS transporter permease subunit [Nocardia sp. CDC153]